MRANRPAASATVVPRSTSPFAVPVLNTVTVLPASDVSGEDVRARILALAEVHDVGAALGEQGGVVLLSPGAPSFGAYRDYVARGRHFAALAGFDPDSISAIPGLGIG